MNSFRQLQISDHVSKVYGIVFEAMMIYILGIMINCVFVSSTLMMLGIVGSFVSLFFFYSSITDLQKRLYTDLMAIALGVATSPLFVYAYLIDPSIIIVASLGTFMIFPIFTFMSKFLKDEDTVALGGFLFSSLTILIIAGFVLMFFEESDLSEIAYTLMGILIFCGFIAYDTKIMYQKIGESAEPNHYQHAIELFLDIINILVKLIRLLIVLSRGDKKRR